MAAVPAQGRALRVEPTEATPASALSSLYERYYGRILAFCDRRAKTHEDAEDAAQTTFLQAYRGLQLGTIPRAEEPWLFRIAQNVCVARWRSAGRRRDFETVQDPSALAELAVAPERTDLDLARLKRALGRLPENQRRAILLREWQGLSYREIADELGVGIPSVEALLFRARRGLAYQLEPRQRRLDVGSFLAGLKTLLGGGAVKLAATGAALVATTVVADRSLARQHGPLTLKTAAASVAHRAGHAGSTAAPPRRLVAARGRAPIGARARRAPAGTDSSHSGAALRPRATTHEAPPAGPAAAAAPAPARNPGRSPAAPPLHLGLVASPLPPASPLPSTVNVALPPVAVPTLPLSPPTVAPPALPQTPDLPSLPSLPKP